MKTCIKCNKEYDDRLFVTHHGNPTDVCYSCRRERAILQKKYSGTDKKMCLKCMNVKDRKKDFYQLSKGTSAWCIPCQLSAEAVRRRKKKEELKIKRPKNTTYVKNAFVVNPLKLVIEKIAVRSSLACTGMIFHDSVIKAFEDIELYIKFLVTHKMLTISTAAKALGKAVEFRMYYSREYKDEYGGVTLKL